VYSGILSKGDFRRIKPLGAGRGKLSSRIKKESGYVFISNYNIKEEVNDYNFIIIEDSQLLTRHRYRHCMDLLCKNQNPLLAVQTSPILSSTLTICKKLNCTVWGWDEDLLRNDLMKFSGDNIIVDPETRFPEVDFRCLPNDNYHNLISLAWKAFLKSTRLRQGIKEEPENLSRVYIELSWLIHRVENLAVPFIELVNLETEKGLIPTDKRILFLRSEISHLPAGINQMLELENIVSLCEAALKLESTKYTETKKIIAKESEKCFIVAIDKTQYDTLARLCAGVSNCHVGFYEKPADKDKHNSVYIIGLTGSVDKNYKILKSFDTNKCVILGYDFESGFLNRLEFNRRQLALLLKNRIEVLNSLHIDKYS
jgi:hypothetical protein